MEKRSIEFVMAFGFGACLVVFVRLAYRFIRTKYVRATKCGHITSLYSENGRYVQRVVLDAYGEKQEVLTRLDEGDKPDYCRRCLNEKAVKCFLCGKPIFFDDWYTLVQISLDKCREDIGIVKREDGSLYAACCVRMQTGCQSANDPHPVTGRWKSTKSI